MGGCRRVGKYRTVATGWLSWKRITEQKSESILEPAKVPDLNGVFRWRSTVEYTILGTVKHIRRINTKPKVCVWGGGRTLVFFYTFSHPRSRFHSSFTSFYLLDHFQHHSALPLHLPHPQLARSLTHWPIHLLTHSHISRNEQSTTWPGDQNCRPLKTKKPRLSG